jgi:hypothetical protein
MLRKRKLWTLGLCLVVASCTSLYAQRAHMVHLGDASVDGARDRDTINVGRRAGAFRAIQLRVHGGAVNFDRVIVRYGNGTQEELQIRSTIPSGGQTRIIDLPGERRIIQSVDFWYGKANWLRRPRVSLYGVR